jgi:transposase, IS5 family
MRDQPGFFDIDDRLKRLSDLGDQLEAFRVAVDFETFRPELNAVLSYSNRSQGGRPPFDPVMMFKILVIQAADNLSDARTEFLVNDRLSFMRFLGLSLGFPWRIASPAPARSGYSARSSRKLEPSKHFSSVSTRC